MANQTNTPLKNKCEALMLERVVEALDIYIAQQRKLWAHLLVDDDLALPGLPESESRVA